MNNTSPPNFNFSKNDSTPNFDKSFKKVKFDKSVDIQQLELKEQKEQQKRIQAVLDEKSMLEKIEQLKIDEMYRQTNGVPFAGKFGSPIPMDPFQKNFDGIGFGNIPFQSNTKSMDFETFNASLASPASTSAFSSSKHFNSSKNRISGIHKMQSTNFKNSPLNGSPYGQSPRNSIFSSSKGFNHSKSNTTFKVQSSNNFNSSRSSNCFQNSFRSSSSSNRSFGDSYKTSLCHEFRDFQRCQHGNQCKFAHGNDELRLRPVYPQPQMCKYFLQNLPCPYGNRCKFLHQ